MGKSATKEVGIEEFADILAQSEVMKSSDLGSAIVHDVLHPSMGGMTMINTISGQCAIVTPS